MVAIGLALVVAGMLLLIYAMQGLWPIAPMSVRSLTPSGEGTELARQPTGGERAQVTRTHE